MSLAKLIDEKSFGTHSTSRNFNLSRARGHVASKASIAGEEVFVKRPRIQDVSDYGKLIVAEFTNVNTMPDENEKLENTTSFNSLTSDFDFDSKFGELEQSFFIRDKGAVKGFLIDHFDLISFLPKVRSAIRTTFPNEPLYLEVLEDPNKNAGENLELMVLIGVCEGPKCALPKLESFDNQWWSANEHHANNNLTVDLRYE